MKPVALSAIALVLLAASAAAAEPLKPTSVERIFSDGRHNAFTAFVRWQDACWLAFRNADSHGYGEADIVVLRSSDASDWQEAFRLNILPDDRDPQFLATDNRLFLYVPSLTGAELTTFATYSDDGATWSTPQPVYQPRF